MSRGRRSAAIGVTVLVLALVGAVTWTVGAGYQLFAVLSGSMSPTLAVGDLVVTTSRASIQVGDIVTFGSGRHLTTHRVVDVTAAGLITQGDANTSTDAVPVDSATVVGEVVRSAHGMGYVLVFFKQPTGAASLVLGLVTLVSLWGLFFPPPAEPPLAGARARRHRYSVRYGVAG